MIKWKNESILNATETLILQQVNCRNVMGAGLAKQIYTKWPWVKTQYHVYCKNRDPYDLLGSVNTVRIGNHQWVGNVFGQLNYGRQKVRYTDYNALEKAFRFISFQVTKFSIAIPYNFGCGLANGDWDTVYSLIEKYFVDNDVTIYKI